MHYVGVDPGMCERQQAIQELHHPQGDPLSRLQELVASMDIRVILVDAEADLELAQDSYPATETDVHLAGAQE